MRSWIFWVVLVTSIAGWSAGAAAELNKYALQTGTLLNSESVSPNPTRTSRTVPPGTALGAVALIDDSGPNPVLRKLVEVGDDTATVLVPGLALGLFRSANSRQGPGGTGSFHAQPTGAFTGTGSTAAGGSLRWGSVTGWTISGSVWCNSSPGVLCALGMFADEQTTDPRFNSEFYDLGTWVFHGTGFTSVPYVDSYNTSDFGNVLKLYRGGSSRDPTLPAISWLGTLALAGSLVAGAVAALKRAR